MCLVEVFESSLQHASTQRAARRAELLQANRAAVKDWTGNAEPWKTQSHPADAAVPSVEVDTSQYGWPPDDAVGGAGAAVQPTEAERSLDEPQPTSTTTAKPPKKTEGTGTTIAMGTGMGRDKGDAEVQSNGKKEQEEKKAMGMGMGRSIEEKQAEWRARDAFFLQSGALSSLLGNKCVDSGGGVFDNNALRMWGCSTNGKVGPNQRFALTGDSLLQQPHRRSGHPPFCVRAGPDGTAVEFLPGCDPHERTQQWEYVQLPARHKAYGYLKNRATGKCLTKPPTGRNTSQFKTAPVTLQPCAEGCNQTWSFGEREPSQRTAAWKPPGKSAGRLLCWILTFPAASDTKAAAVNNTWGSKCDHLLYMTTEHVDGLNTVELQLWGPEGRDKLWTKSKLSWLHVFEHYLDKADWFIKADDDTYLAMENLHAYLSQFDTNEPLHFGRLFIAGNNKYFSGGSGIILSKEAVRRMGTAFNNSAEHEDWAGEPQGTGPEDLLTSKSLKPLGIGVQESMDNHGRQLFMPMGLDHEYFAPERDEKNWFYKYSKSAKAGPECCSEKWIASHYTKSPQMYALDILEDVKCIMPIKEWPHLRVHD